MYIIHNIGLQNESEDNEQLKETINIRIVCDSLNIDEVLRSAIIPISLIIHGESHEDQS